MSYAMVGITVGTALMGAYNADQQQRAQNKQNLAAAEHNRYSNWTGRSMNQRFDAPSTLGGAMQGGLSGFAMGRSLGAGGNTTGGAMNKAYGQGASTGIATGGVNHAGGGAGGFGGGFGQGRNPYNTFNNKNTLY